MLPLWGIGILRSLSSRSCCRGSQIFMKRELRVHRNLCCQRRFSAVRWTCERSNKTGHGAVQFVLNSRTLTEDVCPHVHMFYLPGAQRRGACGPRFSPASPAAARAPTPPTPVAPPDDTICNCGANVLLAGTERLEERKTCCLCKFSSKNSRTHTNRGLWNLTSWVNTIFLLY